MKKVAASSVNAMIAAFVKAEIDSTRFGSGYRDILAASHQTRAVVDHPDLLNVAQNRLRHKMLELVRGYPKGMLFQRFPHDARWHLTELEIGEVGQLLYANFPTWIDLSAGTRLVSDGARNLDRVEVAEDGAKVNDNIRAVAVRVRAGEAFPELILVGQRLQMPLVVMEGHTRATAYAVASAPTSVRAIVGTSARMNRWWLY